ncbi:acyl carrier protein [Kitasatospora sp. NPDC058965]|uniref:acyl carrier protein n=1 Tax=Kitasatospora sp. NPDC058965 TaxID=3346682 RepID=UPI0036BA55A6
MTVDAAARTEAVTAIFRRVLEQPQATPDEDFFELGGDSLLATRVLSAVAREFQVELTFEDFLLAPTGAALAARLGAAA